MNYIDVLKNLHALLKPELYFEIGVRDGKSLTHSRSFTIAIDPNFRITYDLMADIRLFRQTSDAFFKDVDFAELSSGKKIDFAFIDGMHLAEFALRDLVNCVRHCAPNAIIVLDDVIPMALEITSRKQLPGAWTGDVYKLPAVLQSLGLQPMAVDTRPSGLCVLKIDDKARQIILNELPKFEEEIQGGTFEKTSVEEIKGIFNIITADDLYADLKKN